jgi:hypothetical protein
MAEQPSGADLPPTDPHLGRPLDTAEYHTEELPATPVRDRTITASNWIEAPPSLRDLGREIGEDQAAYKRRIGAWLLWRAGPPAKGDAVYMAFAAGDLGVAHTFRLDPDGAGEGVGPSGATHTRFRSWKEDLRDNQPESPEA